MSEIKNSAFVFVKPHANTEKVQDLVRSKLNEAGIDILSEASISGEEIDSKKLIDQHYYAIASKATILPAKDIPVPTEKFEAAFGEKWATALEEERACNAMEACAKFGCDAASLDKAWAAAEKVEKFGGVRIKISYTVLKLVIKSYDISSTPFLSLRNLHFRVSTVVKFLMATTRLSTYSMPSSWQ